MLCNSKDTIRVQKRYKPIKCNQRSSLCASLWLAKRINDAIHDSPLTAAMYRNQTCHNKRLIYQKHRRKLRCHSKYEKNPKQADEKSNLTTLNDFSFIWIYFGWWGKRKKKDVYGKLWREFDEVCGIFTLFDSFIEIKLKNRTTKK